MNADLYDELKAAMFLYDDWPDYPTAKVVIDSARRLVQAVESRAEMIAHMRATMTPTAEALAQFIGDPK
jgi:hypothetical protein